MSLSGKVNKKKQKRYRSAFTTMQIALLEKEFKKDPYVTNVRREHLANSLGLPERAVKIWFQNRRMKEKRDSNKGYDAEDSDPKSNVKASDDMIMKSSLANDQQTTPTSLAAKIVFSDDMVQVTKKDDCQVTRIHIIQSHDMNLAEKSSENFFQTNVKKETLVQSVNAETPTKPPVDRLDNFSTNGKSVIVGTVEKPIPTKQAVGHVLPFSQIPSEPQKLPQSLTTAAKATTQQNAQENILESSSIPGLIPPYSGFPVDLSKYYSPLSPVPHLPWNRINFVPVMPGSQGLPYFGGLQGVTAAPSNAGPVKKCSCDCHLPSLEEMRAQQAMFYTPYVPHFITSVPTQNSNAKY